jgi:hypothetical protein
MDVVVKFTRTYGVEAHSLLAIHGFAPQLLHCERLAGGWFMVVMERLTDPWVNAYNMEPCLLNEALGVELRSAVDLLHENHFVHGDLRSNNIFVNPETMKISVVDFDWCGVADVAQYPPFMNHTDITWPEGAEDGLVLRPAHDLYWCEKFEFSIRRGNRMNEVDEGGGSCKRKKEESIDNEGCKKQRSAGN